MNLGNYYLLINKLKFTKRQGWLDRELEADTIGAHVFGAVALGWYIANEEHVDSSRVIELLALHDLVMAEMEDVTPKSGKYQGKRKFEELAMSKVAETLPAELREKYLGLFREFNAQETVEAKVAREADKLETLLQGGAYESMMGRDDILDEFLVTYKDVFTTKTGRRILEEIKKEHEIKKK